MLFKAYFEKYDSELHGVEVKRYNRDDDEFYTFNSLIFVCGKPSLHKEIVKILWRTLSCVQNNETIVVLPTKIHTQLEKNIDLIHMI